MRAYELTAVTDPCADESLRLAQFCLSAILKAISLLILGGCVLESSCHERCDDLVSRSPISRWVMACDRSQSTVGRPRNGR